MAHIKTLFQRPDRIEKPLYVVTSVFNSARYRTRWKLYEDFERHCEGKGVELYLVEVAFGERQFAITQSGNPHHIQFRTPYEIWLKENALNLAVQRLPLDWSYVAWIDADIAFARKDWADEAIHLLQHYSIIQMWSHAVELNPEHEPINHWQSLMWCHTHGVPTRPVNGAQYYEGAPPGAIYAHSGFAWAARREAWDALGGLVDIAILGSADWHMAHALLGDVTHTVNSGYTPAYKNVWYEWQARADRSIRRNVGVMPGLVQHYWHGPKASRRYKTREKILVEDKFDPTLDLKRDWQGLWQLTGRSTKLRDDVRRYFHERNEDALPDAETVPIPGQAAKKMP